MSELDIFRAETRAWLEQNCPASMRSPTPDNETVWGGRDASYANPDSSGAWRHRSGRAYYGYRIC